MKISRIIAVLLLLNTGLIFAAPHQVVIVRHGDKLMQKGSGSVLSPKGQLRAIAFAYYYLKTFGDPDLVITAKPADTKTGLVSLRPIQTVSPLINMLNQKKPNQPYNIYAPYLHGQYKQFTHDLLTDSKYKNKTILVCWAHQYINDIAHALGVKEPLAVWAKDDYDTVFILTFNEDGSLKSFMQRHHQYPITFNGTWLDILKHTEK